MNPPIHALKQHNVHFLQQFRNRVHDLDPHLAQLLSEFADAVATRRDVRAAGITGYDANACDIPGCFGIVEDFGEGGDMGSIEANHSGTQGSRIGSVGIHR